MKEKYGKSSNDILKIKSSFFTENKSLLEENLSIAEIYRAQPKRTNCKNCGHPLADIFFVKHGINYFLCSNCSHLNGGHEETQEFADKIYIESDYGRDYRENKKVQYIERVTKIYKPKAEFLIECLSENGENEKGLSYLDIGAGSGYFVYALYKELEISFVKGVEISSAQTDYGNKMIGTNLIEPIALNDLCSIVRNCNSQVISLIGVIEHLINPKEVLTAIQGNNIIQYCFISVPLFSYSSLFEIVNQNCFNRQLGGAHTHLYTLESIMWLCEKYNLEIIGKWHFGTDMMDLFRYTSLNMKEVGCSHEVIDYFSEKFLSIIDKLQLKIDESEFCSEVHLVLQKKK